MLAPAAPVGSPVETLPPGLSPAGFFPDTPLPTAGDDDDGEFLSPSTITGNPVLAQNDPERREVQSRFVLSNTAGLDADDLSVFINERFEIRDTYNSLAERSVTEYAIENNLEYLWHSGRVDGFEPIACPETAPEGSICLDATTKFVLLIDTNFNADSDLVVTEAASLVQNRIDQGDLQCELDALFPTSVIVIETGGGCSNSAEDSDL